MSPDSFDLQKYLTQKREILENALLNILSRRDEQLELTRAMRHSLMAGGKRLRPVLCMAAADSAQALHGEAPRVETLSFSTNGSAHHASVDKVVQAAHRVREQRPDIAIDEDVQLDAAIVAEIAERKLPTSRVKGTSNVLVFPNLEAGNIGYKLAERIGGAEAIGPLLQGLSKPANDLSRGCSTADILNVIAVTVVQAQQRTP